MITNDNKRLVNNPNKAELEQGAANIAPLWDFGAADPIAKEPSRSSLFPESQPNQAALPLENPQHERFCQLCAYGEGDGIRYKFFQAYKIAFDKKNKKMTDASARANSSRLRADHPEIDQRIAYLDKQLREEVMLQRGATFARTLNKVSDVVEAMSKQKSNPRAASVLVSAASLILKATGTEEPPKTTLTAQMSLQQGSNAATGGECIDAAEVERKIQIIMERTVQ